MTSVEQGLLLRYFYEAGGVQAALPMRAVEDSGSRVVGWLASQTEIMHWATSNGEDPRSVPLERRFTEPLATAPRVWQGPGVLRVMLPREPFQVINFWDEDGGFRGWYVNFEAPFMRTGSVLDTVDWHLDLWIDPDGTWRWKDEDEADAAVAAGALSEGCLDQASDVGAALAGDVGRLLALCG